MPTGRGTAARYGNSAGISSGPAAGISFTGRQGRIDPHSSDFVSEDTDAGWLSLKSVEMVMMHELAHCIQMNHSKAFWAVRNEYVVHLKVLWGRKYTGEGMWGRGQALENGHFGEGRETGAGEFEDLCGGAYRGRGRKRKGKGKEKVSYAERKKRRLDKTEKKFGKGQSVGENEHLKIALEGKMVGSKPKVAGSKRGRELRAAAALARFEVAKVEKSDDGDSVKDEDETEDETESESDTDFERESLVDVEGKQIKDSHGHGLYRVCGDTDTHKDADAKNELDELNDLDIDLKSTSKHETSQGDVKSRHSKAESNNVYHTTVDSDDDFDNDDDDGDLDAPPRRTTKTTSTKPSSFQASISKPAEAAAPTTKHSLNRPSPTDLQNGSKHPQTGQRTCPVCSLDNPQNSATCAVCAHVLDRNAIKGSWACKSSSCQAVGYVNSGDAGVCGLCGGRKS